MSATTSLPVPLSPVMSTRVSDGAMSAMSWNNAMVSGLCATICRRQLFLRAKFQRRGGHNAGGLPDGGEQFIEINRLGEIIQRAVAHGDHGVAMSA